MRKSCFVIMPFGDVYLDEYYQKIVKPTVETAGYTVKRADEIYGVKPIIHDIFDSIREADILIADVTGRNPNVNYELGAAHMIGKEVILLSQTMEDVPFDYRHIRTIVYDPKSVDFADVLRNSIQNTIRTIEKRMAGETGQGGEYSEKASRYAAVCKSGWYYGKIVKCYPPAQNWSHTFYELEDLIRLEDIPDAEDYAEGESHWIAVWGNKLMGRPCRLNAKDVVRFKMAGISRLKNYNHVSHARNVTIQDDQIQIKRDGQWVSPF